MPNILIEIEGVPRPVRELSWAYRLPCGCIQGCMLPDVFEEEAAWHQWFEEIGRKRERSREINKQRATGYTLTLEVRKAITAEIVGPPCPHKEDR